FLWIPGTGEPPQDALSNLFISEMASRGFIAGSVQYSNTEHSVETCDDYTHRAEGIFNASRAGSGVNAICSLTGAACNKGVVVAGVSQGGAIAILAKNYASSISAVYALSMADTKNFDACLAKSTTVISSDKLTIVNGASDSFQFGGQGVIQNTSGLT